MSGERSDVYRMCSAVIAASEGVNKEHDWGSYVTDKWKVDTSVSALPYVVKEPTLALHQWFLKCARRIPRDPRASSSQGIRGYISVMVTLKFTSFLIK